MSLFLEDLNQWYEQYEVASPKEQYEQLLELVSTTIDPNYVNGTELGDVLIEMQSLLEAQGLFEEAVSLTKLVQEHQPEFYQKEFCYLGNFLIQYGLLQKDDDLVDNALAYYKQDPVKGIDMLLPVFNDLCLYDKRQRVVELSRAIYKPVATSSKLLGGSEMEFGLAILADLFEKAYEEQKQGNTVDWDNFRTEAEPFGLNPDSLPILSVELSGQGNSGDTLVSQFKADKETVLRSLFMRFQMRMFDQRHLSFVCSQFIWIIVLEFLNDPERLKSKKKVNTLGKFFNLDQKKLDRHVARLLSTFFSDRKSEGFTVLWGIPHVYEFLHNEGLIEHNIYDEAIATVTNVKKDLLGNWPRSLWPYCFVHHWGKPAYQSEADFTAEAQRFADSAKESTPLSEEPSEPFSEEEALSGLNLKFPKNWPSSSPAASPKSTTSSKSGGSNPPQKSKPLKASKPRKSGLSEIKALNKKSKNKKKKKKKGF